MDAILRGALAGIAGAGFGVALAWVLGRAWGRKPAWLSFVPVLFAIFAVTLTRPHLRGPEEEVMAALDPLPTVQALKTYYPDDYRRLETRVRALPRPATAEDARAAVGGVFGDVVLRQRPLADAASSYAMFRETRAQGAALRAIDPPGCNAFLDGRSTPASLAKVLTPETTARDAEASSRLLAQTATRPAAPATPMSEEDVSRLTSDALSKLPDATKNIAIGLIESGRSPATREEQSALCDFQLAFADRVLEGPPAVAGARVRALWARQ